MRLAGGLRGRIPAREVGSAGFAAGSPLVWPADRQAQAPVGRAANFRRG